MKVLITIKIIILLTINSFSQINPIKFQHINIKDGLSQGHALSMLQDSEGYIWVGTYVGLNRYDGYDFKVYKSDNENPNSLFIDVIYSLYEDRDGLIWIGTWGIDIFDKKTESFTHISSDEGNNNLSAPQISSMIQDENGNMWLGTRGGGLNRYDYITKKITYFKANPNSESALHSNIINDLLIDDNGDLIIATENGGLSIMDLEDESIRTYRAYMGDNGLLSDNVTSVFKDNNGLVWIGDVEGNLLTYKKQEKNLPNKNIFHAKKGIVNKRIMDIDQDIDQNLLLATDGSGLVIYNPESGTTAVNLHHRSILESISTNETRSLLIDKNNTVFVGTSGRGISKYSHFNSKFDVYSISVADIENSSINSFTHAIEDTRGDLVVGTYDGFVVFDQKDWSYKHYRPGNSYDENKILMIDLAPDSTIWMSSFSKLYRYDKDFNLIKSYIFDNTLSDHSIYAIEFDHANNLWISLLRKGLLKIPEKEWRDKSKESLDYSLYTLDDKDSNSISSNENWEVYEDKDSNLWICGIGGLCKYNYEQNNFERYFTKSKVKSIRFDSKGTAWLITIADGLYSFDIGKRTYINKAKKYGTTLGIVFGLIIDKFDNIWLNTELGLAKYNIANETFRTYFESDGLPSDHFDDKSEVELSNGNIYMGTTDGFVLFKPEEIVDDSSSGKIVLTSLFVNDEKVDKYPMEIGDTTLLLPIERIKEIELTPDQRDFTLNFATLHYVAPHKIEYLYKLNGFDKNWNSSDSDVRSAKYTNIDYGNYTFVVKSTNSDGKWVNKPLEIKIIILPPFYHTILFRILATILFVFLIYLFVSWRIRIIKKQKIHLISEVEKRTEELTNKNKLLEDRQVQIEEQRSKLSKQKDELTEINATKDKLFSIIAHDLKNPFHVIMGYCDLLIDQYGSWDDEKKLQFLRLLKDSTNSAYRLLENLLHWSRNQRGSVVVNSVSSSAQIIINEVVTTIESFANKKNITIKTELDNDDYEIFADVDMVNLILRNLISNAIKFSKKGDKVILRVFRKNEKFIQFSVIDNGIGIPNEEIENLFSLHDKKIVSGTHGEKGTGLGLVLCKEFVVKNGGEIWGESNNKETIFHFTIPLSA